MRVLKLAALEDEVRHTDLVEKLDKQSEVVVQHEMRASELEQTVQELNNKIASSEGSLQVSENALQQVTSIMSALTAERDDLLCQLTTQSASNQLLETNLEALHAQFVDAVASSESKTQTIGEKDSKIAELSAEAKVLTESTEKLSQLNVAQIVSLQSELATVQADVLKWTNLANENQSRCETLQKQQEDTFNESEARASRVTELEEELASQNSLFVAKSAELENIQQALEQAQLSFDAERETMRAELLTQETAFSKLARACEELQAQLAIAEADAITASQKICELSEQFEASCEAVAAAEETAAKLAVSISDLSATAEERALHITELETKLTTLRAEIVDQETSAGILKSELSSVNEALEREQAKLLDFATQLQVSESLVHRQEALLQEKTIEMEALQTEISVCAAELERVNREVSAAATHSQDLQVRLDASEEACAAMTEKATHLKAEIDALQAYVSQLSSEISAKEDTIQEFEMQCKAKSATIISLEQQLQALCLDHNETEAQRLAAHTKAIEEVESQVVDLHNQLDHARSSVLKHQQLQAIRETELAELQLVSQKLREELVCAQTSAEEEQSAHEVENLSLNGRIAENQFVIEELRTQVESLIGEIARSKQVVEVMESTCRSSEAREEASAKQVLALEQEKTALEQRLAELTAEFSQAMSNLTAAESARATATAKLSLDQASLHEMATQLVEAKAAHQQCQKQLSEQKGVNKAQQEELTQSSEKMLLLEHRLAERASAESTLQTELRTMEQHETTLKAELKRSHADLSIMSARLQDASADISHLKEVHANELARWRHDIHDRESALQELNYRLLQQMEQNDDLKRLLQDENMSTNKLKRELNERTAQLSELTVDHGVLGAQEHIHSKEVQELKAQLHSAEVTVADLKQELHVLTLESANLAVSVRQRQEGIQKLTVTLTEKDQKTQQLHASSMQLTQELATMRNKLHASKEKSAKMEMEVKSLTTEVEELRQKVTDFKKEHAVWETKTAEMVARIQEGEFVIQELNNRLVECENTIAEHEKRARETVSEKQRLSSEFSSIRDMLKSNLAEVAQEKQSNPSSPVRVITVPSVSASGELISSLELLVKQKDEMLKAHTASWNAKVEELETRTTQRVESIREALETQFEAQVAAQHIESRMLEDKIATLEGLLSAAQQELHQCHESHPEPTAGEADAAALVPQQNSAEEIRCLQAGVTRLRAKVASKSKQILILNQQMLKDRQNFQKLKRSLVKLDGLKAAVFANNFNPAVPAPPLPANQVSELFHLGMEEATKKMELKQQKLLLQQQEEFQRIRDTLENSLTELETHAPVANGSNEGFAALTHTISALHAELRDKAAACQESQRLIQALRQRHSAKEAAHYLALSEKTVECNALRATLQDIENKLNSQSCSQLSAEPNELQQQAVELRNQLTKVQVELQVMTQRQAEGHQKFQRAVRTIKVLEARSESLKEECVATNGEILRLHQKASNKKRSEN